MIKNNIIIIMIYFLAACSNENSISSLKKELETKKHAVVESKKIKPSYEISRLPLTAYKSGDRNPFEVKAAILNEKKSLEPLNMFSLNTLRFVGTIKQGVRTYAIIITPDNLTYKVKIGDSLGDHYGKIVDITTDKIKVMESFTENKKEISERMVTLQLKDEQQ